MWHPNFVIVLDQLIHCPSTKHILLSHKKLNNVLQNPIFDMNTPTTSSELLSNHITENIGGKNQTTGFSVSACITRSFSTANVMIYDIYKN